MRPPSRTHRNRDEPPNLIEIRHRQSLDALVGDYVCWREACAMVAAAYDTWKGAGREERTLAFSEYIAALDGEQEAATVYQRAVEQLAAMTRRRGGSIQV